MVKRIAPWRLSRAAVLVLPVFALGCHPTRAVDRATMRAAWHFDDQVPQRALSGWRITATNLTAAPATWQVVTDPTAPSPPHVFALTKSDNYDGTYNLAIADGAELADLDLSVKVKAVAGQEDQGGGPIWRCQDENNYYICRFNPLEANFRVYVVANGKRRQLDSVKLELGAERWYEIRVRMVGSQITCYLDGEQMLGATDSTIAAAGRVGLWTKADAVTAFDDLRVAGLGAAEHADPMLRRASFVRSLPESQESARLLSREDTVGLRSGLVVLQPGADCGWHSTDDYEELIICLAGAGEVASEDSPRCALAAGQYAYHPPYTRHNVFNTGQETMRYVYVVAPARASEADHH